MTDITRRTLIASAVAVPSASLAYQAPQPDPHRAWFEEWKHLRAEWEANGHDSDGEETEHGEAVWKRAAVMEEKIFSTKAQTVDGALAQIEWIIAEAAPNDFLHMGHFKALEQAAAALGRG